MNTIKMVLFLFSLLVGIEDLNASTIYDDDGDGIEDVEMEVA